MNVVEYRNIELLAEHAEVTDLDRNYLDRVLRLWRHMETPDEVVTEISLIRARVIRVELRKGYPGPEPEPPPLAA